MKIFEVSTDNLSEQEFAQYLLQTNNFVQNNTKALKSGQLLYRGVNSYINSDYELFKKQPRKGPSHTALLYHQIINTLSKEKFGFEIRKDTVFCAKSLDIAKTYAKFEPYVFIPKAEYGLYYNENVSDLTIDLNLMTPIDNRVVITLFSQYRFTTNLLPEFISEYRKYTNIHKDEYHNISTFKELHEFLIKFIKNYLNIIDNDDPYFERKLLNSFDGIFKGLVKEKLERIQKYIQNIHSTKFIKNIDSNVEIMADCNEYYLIDIDYFEKVISYF